jgi:hypothetical protein
MTRKCAFVHLPSAARFTGIETSVGLSYADWRIGTRGPDVRKANQGESCGGGGGNPTRRARQFACDVRLPCCELSSTRSRIRKDVLRPKRPIGYVSYLVRTRLAADLPECLSLTLAV